MLLFFPNKIIKADKQWIYALPQNIHDPHVKSVFYNLVCFVNTYFQYNVFVKLLMVKLAWVKRRIFLQMKYLFLFYQYV